MAPDKSALLQRDAGLHLLLQRQHVMRGPDARQQAICIAADQLRPREDGLCSSTRIVGQGVEGDLQLSPVSGRRQCSVPTATRPIVCRHADNAGVHPQPLPAGCRRRGQHACVRDAAVPRNNAVDVRRQGLEGGPELVIRCRRPQKLTNVPGAAMKHGETPASGFKLDAPREGGHPMPQVVMANELLCHVRVPIDAVLVALAIFRETAAAVQLG
mmetsp:Transcript_69855/g.227297  ORF Transcript_69855/g.227297 Transcript_69855/m.227297 type:complete len:214 (+) Transcript_69855:432-1073(+)